MAATTVKSTRALDLETIGALDELQKRLALAPATATRWSRAVRAERRAGCQRREGQARRSCSI